MKRRNQAAFTWVEVIVCVVILVVLASLAIPQVGGPTRNAGPALLSNMKQIHLTCQQMVLDGKTTGDKSLGWPGIYDTFDAWATNVVPAYLSTNDFCKLFSGPGIIVPLGKMPKMNETAIRVYALTAESPDDAVVLTSANFTNTPMGGEPLSPSAKPYGTKGFVVFRKGGDGSIYQPKQVGNTNIIGSFVPLCR